MSTDDERDREAVRAVLAGDVDAFERIVHRWQGPLVGLALRFAGERARAEDLAQDAFLQAFRSLRSYRGRAAFSTWLFSVAMNVYRSALRRRDLPLDREQPVEELGADSDDDAENEHAARVRRAVGALPEHYRDVVHLYYFHGSDLAAAARTLGLRPGTAKARLSRARTLLERALAPTEELPWAPGTLQLRTETPT